MKRIDTPAAVDGKFVKPDTAAGIAGTATDYDWANHIQEEIVSIIEENGGNLDPKDDKQSGKIIKSISDKVEGLSGLKNLRIVGNVINTSFKLTDSQAAEKKVVLADGKSLPVSDYPLLSAIAPTTNISLNNELWKDANKIYLPNFNNSKVLAPIHSENLALSYPWGIAVENGIVYIANTARNEVKIARPDGTTESISGHGSPNSYLFGIAVENGIIYIADHGNNAIKKYKDGELTTLIDGATSTPSFVSLNDVAVENGVIYISQKNSTSPLLKYDEKEGVLTDLKIPTLNDPRGIAVENGILYIAYRNDHKIKKYENGVVTDLKISGLNNPSGIAVENGVLYIADTDNSRVIKYENELVTELATGLSEPTDVDVEDGIVYIVERYRFNGYRILPRHYHEEHYTAGYSYIYHGEES